MVLFYVLNKMEDDNLISRINSALAFVLWTINTIVAIAIAIVVVVLLLVVGGYSIRCVVIWFACQRNIVIHGCRGDGGVN